MTPLQFASASLRYFWRTNLAVVLGVAVAAAVVGGALVVGDSMRESLAQLTLKRLGGVDHALLGQRFFREALADEVGRSVDADGLAVAPALSLVGSLQVERQPVDRVSPTGAPAQAAPQPGTSPQGRPAAAERVVARAGNVRIYGVDHRFWQLAGDPYVDQELVVSQRLAEQLQLTPGDEVSVLVEIPSAIPRDTLLGDRNETTALLTLRVAAVAGDDTTAGRFGLNPTQQSPLSAFIPLRTLQQQIGLNEVIPTQRNPEAKPGRVNTLFAGQPRASSVDGSSATAVRTARDLHPVQEQALGQAIQNNLQLADLALTVRPRDGYVSIEAEQMILDDSLAAACERTARSMLPSTPAPAATPTPAQTPDAPSDLNPPDRPTSGGSPALVYLLNELTPVPADSLAESPAAPIADTTSEPPTKPKPLPHSMYSLIAGVDFGAPAVFSAFQFTSGGPPQTAGECVINEWLAEDLGLAVGGQLRVQYHQVGDRGLMPELQHDWRVAGIVALTGPAADQHIAPNVPGVTDAETYDDWREPFPLKRDLITDRDDEYWTEHKTTPKVFIRLGDAQEIFKSRYGRITSYRIAGPGHASAPDEQPRDTAGFAAQVERTLRADLAERSSGLGFQFRPVKLEGLVAAAGTNDFAGLFFGFSMFLIAAAVLLVGLLFRLNIERRTRELGLLGAVGWPGPAVRSHILREGLLLVGLGSALGVPAAIGFAQLMVYGLKTWWIGAVGTRFLVLAIRPVSLALGALIAIMCAGGAIWWSLRAARQVSTRELLAGRIEVPFDIAQQGRSRTSQIAWGMVAVILIASLLGLVPDREAFGGLSWRIVAFFVVGLAALTGSLASLSARLRGQHSAVAVSGQGSAALLRMGLRNAARHPARSVLTTALLAAATFVVVAVAAGRRDPTAEAPQIDSGNGGFLLVAESSQPVLHDLNTSAGRAKLGFTNDQEPQLSQMYVAGLRMQPGEDSSCLNLYRTQTPTILGLPADVVREFASTGRFKFVGARPSAWNLLLPQSDSTSTGTLDEQTEAADGPIPVIGDMNTLMFSLKKGVGDHLSIETPALGRPGQPLSDRPTTVDLQVAGILDSSVFQGVLLMSEADFLRLFPNRAGPQYFLIEAAGSRPAELSGLLESRLGDLGFDAEPVSDRLAAFLAVQNTYLSTFLVLGGLGLVLGALGLATVMLRNVLERRSELALLRAVGLGDTAVRWLVLFENSALLLWGLGTGTGAALLAMAPHLLSTGAAVPWTLLLTVLIGVFLAGTLSALFAIRETTRTSILDGLRTE